jgi:hypothetical protein
MSIRLFTKEGKLDIGFGGEPDTLTLAVSSRTGSWIVATIPTKVLVMAIKQVEEERDAKREKSRPYS